MEKAVRVYLDNAATTQLDATCLAEMLPYFTSMYGNPSSLHKFGRDAAAAVDSARERIAAVVGAKPTEIYFTSGGTESDNWAIRGIVAASNKPAKHVITSAIEHPAVMDTLAALERAGVKVTYLSVNEGGFVNPNDLRAAICEDTVLITIMYANNEIGTIQPIAELAAIAKESKIPFHTDAVQAAGSIEINVVRDKIDLLSVSAHKFHGPKGVGFLYVRSGIKLQSIITGGHQERAKRAGTTNTPLIVGMACALEIAARDRLINNTRMAELREYLADRVTREIPYSKINGAMTARLSNNINFSFDFIEGESILMLMDLAGVAVSTGSACSSGSLEPSHVILALGRTEETAHSSMRFSLGRDTTKADIDYAVDALKKAVARLRSFSPLFAPEKGDIIYV